MLFVKYRSVQEENCMMVDLGGGMTDLAYSCGLWLGSREMLVVEGFEMDRHLEGKEWCED